MQMSPGASAISFLCDKDETGAKRVMPGTSKSASWLARFCALLGPQRYAEAEPFLLQGYEGMKQRKASTGVGFYVWQARAGERLIRYYEATHQPEKASSLRKELEVSSRSR